MQTYSKGKLNNIVHTVRYELTGELNGKTKTSFMPITFDEPDSKNFIDFSKLTEAQVLAWVTNKLGQDEIDALENGIDSSLNEAEDPNAPPVLTQTSLPW